jgi:enoyl-CoA hydratase/carnithine racemase
VTDYHQISYHVDGAIATVTLNRPEARNGYTLRMADELAAAFDAADSDEAVRVVVFTGAGDDFCVGADLSGGSFGRITEAGATERPDWNEPAGRCSLRIFAMDKPVIAAIRGAAVGAGSTIVLACDYRLAADDARFGFVFSRRGVYPEGASSWFLPRLVGLGTALDWMVSGRVFGADEALRRGLVQQVHDSGDVLDRAYELARELAASTAPVSVAVIRQLLYGAAELASPYDVQRIDSRLIASLADSPDALEGVRSFLERRPPAFPGTVGADLPGWLPRR